MRAYWSARSALVLGACASVILVVGLGGWGVFSSLSGAVIASGRIEVEDNRQIVQHPEGGVVAEIAVQEGDRVAAGDVLIRLDGASIASERIILQGQLDELLASRLRLEAERDEKPGLVLPDQGTLDAESVVFLEQSKLFSARRETLIGQVEQLEKRRAQIEEQARGIVAQGEALKIQAELAQSELKRENRLLEKGLSQAGRTALLAGEVARLNGDIGQVRALAAESQSRIAEIDLEILNLKAQRREAALDELRVLGPRLIELQERLSVLDDRIAALEIKAPVAGIVIAMSVTSPRSVIKAAEPLLFLVPQDRPLIISAQIPLNDVDGVYPDQPARLVFPALQQSMEKDIWGKVLMISADSLVDPQTQQAYYRATITLDPLSAAQGETVKLLPGMAVDAYLQTGARSPISYLMQPLARYIDRAWRER